MDEYLLTIFIHFWILTIPAIIIVSCDHLLECDLFAPIGLFRSLHKLNKATQNKPLYRRRPTVCAIETVTLFPVADLEILKGGFNKERRIGALQRAEFFASATPTSGHVVVPCTYVRTYVPPRAASCALKNCVMFYGVATQLSSCLVS